MKVLNKDQFAKPVHIGFLDAVYLTNKRLEYNNIYWGWVIIISQNSSKSMVPEPSSSSSSMMPSSSSSVRGASNSPIRDLRVSLEM